MKPRTLMTVRGVPVTLNEDGSVAFTGGMTIDADGGYRTYAPPRAGLRPLDFLANAGGPGNWYGVVTDQAGQPVIQGPMDPAPGYYVSPTAYMRKGYVRTNPRAYLDTATVPFIVVPGPLRSLVRPTVLGCLAVITHVPSSKQLRCVVGDIGPASHLGEASMAAARFFGVNESPKTGGTDARVFRYHIFPGTAAEGFDLLPA